MRKEEETNMSNTKRMFGAAEHLWCVTKNGRYPFTQPTHAPHPLIPKNSNLGVSLSDGGNLFSHFTPRDTNVASK